MFERRIKILLACLIGFTVLLIGRAVQVQVFNGAYWREQAVAAMARPELIETHRGRLLDRNGKVLAEDTPCLDACVDFRAIQQPPDQQWVKEIARARLGSDLRRAEPAQREPLLRAEIERVNADIQHMWQSLADYGGFTYDQMDDVRRSILLKVKFRQRFVWYQKYKAALAPTTQPVEGPGGGKASLAMKWYQALMSDEASDEPEIDQYTLDVAEQTQPHVILPAVSNDVANALGKDAARLPGLTLNASMHRSYPQRDVAAHLLGRMSQVDKYDLQHDPAPDNDLRRYWPNDPIGRSGLEALCEPLLRGTRGRIEHFYESEGKTQRESRVDPIPGQDVFTTIDSDLQRDAQVAFKHVKWGDRPEETMEAPGAAILIDVPTGEVLAMASNPGFDNNQFDELYKTLAADLINRPLMNRATQFAVEPGSTAKIVTGIGAITDRVIQPLDTIECTGYLVLDGHKLMKSGRCWTASMYSTIRPDLVAHHQLPERAPHPTGELTFPDGLERSCNVFFETVADRMGPARLAKWQSAFGLGRRTGIGIPEREGQIIGDFELPPAAVRAATYSSGIGQGQVLATPIQMANIAATVARDGVWVRPHLISFEQSSRIRLINKQSADEIPDRVDMHLDPQAIAEAKLGMRNVVNGAAGTGTAMARADMVVAGKTGSAQTPPLRIPRIEDGKIVMKSVRRQLRGEDGTISFVERRVPEMEEVAVGTETAPNPLAPWHRHYGTHNSNSELLSHAWCIGYAPADNPKIAFAVMLEYGGSGGVTAGSVVQQLLDACKDHGYLASRQ